MFRMNGYVQDERYTAGAGMRRSGASQFCTLFGAGRAGAMPVNLAQCVTQGQGETGNRSKGHELLFSADYADYADYCMRLA
jgi:hypothetical protein